MLLYQLFTGRRARRLYLALFLAISLLSVGVRIRSYLRARKIQAVISGLARLRVDETTEEQLLKTVPYLVLNDKLPPDRPHVYFAEISNSSEVERVMGWVPSFLYSAWQPEILVKPKWDSMLLPTKIAYVLGLRNLSFRATVTVLNGTVSSSFYSIEPDVLVGFPLSYLVVVRSAHGFWMAGRRSYPVYSTDDESPDFRFGRAAGQFSLIQGFDSSIGAVYTSTAPRDLVAHAYQVDLRCFWGIFGCDSVRQVTPLLWQDRQAIEAAAAARITQWSAGSNPCPDRILAGRVRTQLDLNVALLEVVNSRSEMVNREGTRTEEIVTDYRLREVIRGHPEGPWTNVHYRWSVTWPPSPTGETFNPVRPSNPKPGERFLYFSGPTFDSCRMVPASPSAESSVRSAVPAPRRDEDELSGFLGSRM